jgi:hypothetical protein
MATSDQLIHIEEGTVFWTPDAGVEVEIDCKSFGVKPKKPIARLLGSKYGRQNIGGTPDITGEAVIYVRRDEFPYTLLIQPGLKGTFRAPFYDGGPEWEIPVILGEEFTDDVYMDNETEVHTLTVPWMLDGDFPDYPS